MELHPVRRVLGVTKAHHGAVGGPRGDDQLVRNRRAVDDERVVASRLEGIADARQHARVVVTDPRRLAVRRLVAHHLGAEGLAHALVAEAHAEDGHLAGEVAKNLRRDARIGGGPGTRRDDDAAEGSELGGLHGVVAEHFGLAVELGHVLDEVVCEGVVVVDDREPSRHRISSAICTALNIAPAFSSVSSNSRSGRESATTPAPAWTKTSPPATTSVRSVIAMSRLPPKPT